MRSVINWTPPVRECFDLYKPKSGGSVVIIGWLPIIWLLPVLLVSFELHPALSSFCSLSEDLHCSSVLFSYYANGAQCGPNWLCLKNPTVHLYWEQPSVPSTLFCTVSVGLYTRLSSFHMYSGTSHPKVLSAQQWQGALKTLTGLQISGLRDVWAMSWNPSFLISLAWSV